MARPVYIIDGARTPFLKAQGGPGPFTPVDLAVQAGRPLLARQPFAPTAFDQVILGCVSVIADEMKLGGTTDDEKVKLLIEHLRGMNDALNIPHCIQHYGPDSYPAEQGFVPENVFLERLPEIAKNAIADACTGSNPRQPSQEEMEKLLKCCYYDTEVDF